MWNRWVSLCSHYPLLSFQAVPWRNHIPCECLNVIRNNLFEVMTTCGFYCGLWAVRSVALPAGLWLEHPSKTVLVNEAPMGSNPPCGRQGICRCGWRGQWQMASGLCCITSRDGTCRVSCRKPHSQQFTLSSLKQYPFICRSSPGLESSSVWTLGL